MTEDERERLNGLIEHYAKKFYLAEDKLEALRQSLPFTKLSWAAYGFAAGTLIGGWLA